MQIFIGDCLEAEKMSYKYSCDECDSYVATYELMKCPICSINLCESCKDKNLFHVCSWCKNMIPPQLHGRRTAIIISLIVMPILFLFMPVPKPVIFMFFEGSSNPNWEIWYLLGMILLLFTIYPILLYMNKKKILNALKNDAKIRNELNSEGIEENIPSEGTSEVKNSGSEN